MAIDIAVSELEALLDWRERYRQEMNCQIVHDSWHARGFTRIYTLHLEGRMVGYGATAGEQGGPSDTVKEFYVEPTQRAAALTMIRALIAATGAQWIEAQTNDSLLSRLLHDCTIEPLSKAILFADARTTDMRIASAQMRRLTPAERAHAFAHTSEPVGDWGLEVGGVVVATGGFFLHYNPPYGDLYMEVAPDVRQRGYGSFFVQELKRECYAAGRVPAARCNVDNAASRRTLERAGLRLCGRIVRGRIVD